MARVLSDEDIDAIAHRLTDFSGLTSEEHKDHHDAFAIWIKRQEKREIFWDKVKEQVGGWVVIAIFGGIATLAWHGAVWSLERLKG
jgi:hypothetical protein